MLLVICFAALVVAILGAMPRPHSRIHYLISGTVPTCLGPLGALVWVESGSAFDRALTVSAPCRRKPLT